MYRSQLLMPVAVLTAISCSIDDSDRCPSGYTWAEDYLSCIEVPTDTEDTAGLDTESETSTDLDAGPFDGGIDTDEPDIGYGTECFDDSHCASFTADFCNTSPIAPNDPGYCTTRDCSPGDCPDGYQCCDCRDTIFQAKKTVCLNDEQAAQVSVAPANCTCSN
ncbi:MAG: hypothetical protein GY847_14845 [Proteobacteria bacterium]|nr:hypothetical protein [Pseudomonadota bacterium]